MPQLCPFQAQTEHGISMVTKAKNTDSQLAGNC